MLAKKPIAEWDAAALLKLMWEAWNEVFGRRSAARALAWSGAARLAQQVGAPGAVLQRRRRPRPRLDGAAADRRLGPAGGRRREDEDGAAAPRFDEQVRGEKRKAAARHRARGTGTLKPWREVVTPHKDVASGRYQQAEFAADLWQVHLGEGHRRVPQPGRVLPPHLPDREPEAAAGRGVQRLSRGGDPVVQLQTNFGGGKTHSMLALYHLFSGAPASWPASTR
jgi:hypothetical protein